jgi:alpha-tubulin suppressor-like RCC1 family protein
LKSIKTKRSLIQIWLLCAVVLQAITSGAQPVTKIAGGYAHSLFVKSDGSLWAMGWNQYGQLGDGASGLTALTNRPVEIVASNVKAIATGRGHSLLLKSDGSLWAMGDNQYGELGDYSFTETNLPEQIVASNVTAIAAGDYHSLFLKSDGSLWAMGDDNDGQLGDGSYNDIGVILPEQVVSSNVTAIAAGSYHSLFLKSDGSLWGMGLGSLGALGEGTINSTNRPEQIVASNVTAIAAGYNDSLFIKSDGSLWAMGFNQYGKLGDGTQLLYTNLPEQIVASNVTAIAAGDYHSLFLKSDGSLWGMGYNGYGQLGAGTQISTNQPEPIVASNVTAIAAGDYHSLFLKSDGSLWGMGWNEYGQLGDGTYGNMYGYTILPEQIVVNPAYNQISIQLLNDGTVSLSFVGMAGTNYALDYTFSLSPANWVPLATNPADSGGALVFTNTPDPTTNNFWRIRSVP